MSIDIIRDRLKSYQIKTIEDEEHALKEILQEVALFSLANANFFERGVFHGGTALRILYGLPRFSEDLDFMLMQPDQHFRWEPYIDAMAGTFEKFGVIPEVKDKSDVEGAVKKMFLKDDSLGKLLLLSFKHHPGKKLTIKFELDTNPPEGSSHEVKFIDFPYDFSIVAHDLASSFAGKCHALLARKFIKGRDWYDFSWYVGKRIIPNFNFLKAALWQHGPWAEQELMVTPGWFVKALKQKIESIDWRFAVHDVEVFLNQEDRERLRLWSREFFLDKLSKLEKLMIG